MQKLLLALTAAVAMVLAGAAHAEYPEEDIIFVIPYSPGGGFDATARQLARVLPKYLPNDVNVVPKNLPGAGGRRGTSEIYRAEPDGYTIGIFNMPGAAIPQLTGESVSYDITKITWIARAAISPYIMGANPDSGIKTLEDIKKRGRPLKMAHTGYGSTAYTASSITKHVVGFEAVHITGYKGSRNYILGVVRGDAEATMAPVASMASFIRSGDIHPVVTFEEKSSFPGVPTIAEAGYPQLTGLGVVRLIGAPPGLPADIQKILSDAIGKAIRDPESQAWAVKVKRPFSYLPAHKTKAAVDQALKNFAEYPDALKEQQ